MGVRIFEHTRVTDFTRSRPCVVRTAKGTLTCDTLILCTNAWAAGIRELSRSIVAITSDMIVTEPAGEKLAEIGWTGGECITDSQMMVNYYQVTRDHRIAFGKGGWGIAYGGNLTADFDRNPTRARVVEADFRRSYPMLGSVRVTHDWSGPIDRTPNSLPLLGRLSRADHIVYGVGWSGNGVGPSVIGGRVLASLALRRKDQWSEYPLVGRSAGKFPPEPIRYWGAHVVRAGVAAKEAAEIEDRKPSWLSVKLSELAPKGLEDKE
jgi:glycine/D-amino acid oxidase-like deaminating enzyme